MIKKALLLVAFIFALLFLLFNKVLLEWEYFCYKMSVPIFYINYLERLICYAVGLNIILLIKIGKNLFCKFQIRKR